MKKPPATPKNLSAKDIQVILGIIDGWQGTLSYAKLIDATEIPLKHRFSRQALFAHIRIREAINNRKDSLKNGSGVKRVNSVELQMALDRINRLEATIERLEKENEAYLAQFVRWASNAHHKGLTPDYLNRPLPEVDRNPSRL
jgi:hypothetical protein